MGDFAVAATVALCIGASIVAWCAFLGFDHEHRITRLETRTCACEEKRDQHDVET